MSLFKLIPGFGWSCFIWWACTRTGDSLPKVSWLNFPGIDKLVHFIFFFILGLSWAYFLKSQLSKFLFFLFFIISIFYGGIIEYFQANFVVNRSGDLWDWLADVLGYVTFFVFWKFFANKISFLKKYEFPRF
jgi:VanZ family protein